MSQGGINPKAWSILNSDEKMALGLQHSMGKSSWQSGEIMSKSHYKYLEIKYRAEKFLRCLTEHFALYDILIVPEVTIKEPIKLYISLCIEKRYKPGNAMREVRNQFGSDWDKERFNIEFNKALKILEATTQEGNLHNLQLYHLLKDFDRWNNFRILPKEHQEFSAFKRRIKNVYKRHIKLVSDLPRLSIIKIRDICKYKSGTNYLYLPLIIGIEFEVIKIKDNPRTLELMKTIGLYVFEKEEVAITYILGIHNYLFTANKDCKDGLNFWPRYREIIKEAHNYESIHNINPTRKYLDTALSTLQYV